jgi:hypothetical protein
MNTHTVTVDNAAVRHARFGKLPERVHYEDLIEERPVSPRDAAPDLYDPEGAWRHYACLAADLGL